MQSAYKLNKQGEYVQPWRTPFPIWNQSVVPCPVLTVASWPAYRFLKRQVRWVWYSHLFQNFPQFIVIPTVKGFGIVNKQKEMFFWNSLAFSMIQQMLAIWTLVPVPFLKPAWTSFQMFTVHVLLKPGLDNFEHYFSSVWGECNCAVVWALFGIALLWDWNENWPFPVLWPLLSFPNLLACWMQHFQSIIFQDFK